MSFYLKVDETGPTVLTNYELFIDDLNNINVKFINYIMSYSPAKNKDQLKVLNLPEQNKIAQYFGISNIVASYVNDMALLFYTYIETGIVFGIGKEYTGKVSSYQANLVIDINNVLLKSNKKITSIGSISSKNNSPLNNENSHSTVLKRFTGVIGVENIQQWHKNYGTLIYSFDNMIAINH